MQNKYFFKISPLILLLLLLSTTGCVVLPHKLDSFPEEQVIVMDGRGELLKPLGNVSPEKNLYSSLIYMDERFDSEQEKRDYLKKSAQKIVKQLRTGKNVVIFLHGGMNLQVSAMKRAQDLLRHARDTDDAPHFVLMNWQSSLYSSYRDRLFAIREGKDYRVRDGKLFNDLAGVFFYFPSDLLSGIARSPLTLERSLVNSNWFNVKKQIEYATARLSYKNKRDDEEWFKNHVTQIEDSFPFSWRLAYNSLMVPFRIVTIPLVDAFGNHAWDVMQRRTTILFTRDDYFDTNTERTKRSRPVAAFR